MGELEVMILLREWRRHIRFVCKAKVRLDFA